MNIRTVKWAQWDKTQSRELLGLFICAQLLHTILDRTDLIIFPLTLQTITIALMMCISGKGDVCISLCTTVVHNTAEISSANFPYCPFFWKNDPLGKILKILFRKKFIATPVDVLCSNFVQFGRREIGKVLHYLPNKKAKFRLALQLSLLCGSHQKSVGASPRQCTWKAPDFIQIGSLLAELYPNVWTRSKRAVKRIHYSTEAYLRAE